MATLVVIAVSVHTVTVSFRVVKNVLMFWKTMAAASTWIQARATQSPSSVAMHSFWAAQPVATRP